MRYKIKYKTVGEYARAEGACDQVAEVLDKYPFTKTTLRKLVFNRIVRANAMFVARNILRPAWAKSSGLFDWCPCGGCMVMVGVKAGVTTSAVLKSAVEYIISKEFKPIKQS